MTKKIAITGPESTGKSTLSELLANYYNSLWVPEYSREYLENLTEDYQLQDVLNIAKGQIKKEEGLIEKSHRFLFCDTELINIKIWCLHRFNQCPEWVIEQIEKNTYDLFLLCNIDIPWVEDSLRENPDKREYFYNWFIKELEYYGYRYEIISGNVFKRLESAIKAVNSL